MSSLFFCILSEKEVQCSSVQYNIQYLSFSLLEAACNMNVGTDPLVNGDVRQSQEPIGDSGN